MGETIVSKVQGGKKGGGQNKSPRGAKHPLALLRSAYVLEYIYINANGSFFYSDSYHQRCVGTIGRYYNNNDFEVMEKHIPSRIIVKNCRKVAWLN